MRLLNLAAPRSEPILRHDQDQNDRIDIYGRQRTEYHPAAKGSYTAQKEAIETRSLRPLLMRYLRYLFAGRRGYSDSLETLGPFGRVCSFYAENPTKY